MKLIRILPFLSLLFLIGACNDRTGTAENEEMVAKEAPSPDEVINRWGDAWNSNDPQQVQNMTADDVVLLMNGREVPRDSIGAWMEYSAANMQNLEMNSMFKGAQGDMAYDSGTFRHNFATDTMDYEGSYTFIWKRGETEDEWKVKVMHISDNEAQTDSTNMQQ